MPTVIGGVIAGTKKGIYKIVIGEHTTDYKNSKVLFSQDCKNLDDLAVGLKDISRKFVIETFALMYGEYHTLEDFEDGFDFDKNGAFIIGEFEKLKEKYDNKKNFLSNSLESLNERFDAIVPQEVYKELTKLFKVYLPMMGQISEVITLETDRDYLDVSIEMFSILYAKVYDLEYGVDIYPKEVENHPFMTKLLKYKMKHYGKEIFGSLGMEIVGKSKDGFIVREQVPNKKENPEKIN